MNGGRLRLAGAVLAITTLGGCTGCEEVALTREPDPPLTTADWMMVWVATVGVGIVVTAHLVLRIRGARTPSGLRVLVGSMLAAVIVAFVGWWLAIVATTWRAASILGWDECRALRPDERPVQIIQLTCISDGEVGTGSTGLGKLISFEVIVVTVAVLVVVVPLAICLLDVLRSATAPLGTAIAATPPTVLLAGATVEAVGERMSAVAWSFLLGPLLASAVAAAVCWSEVLSARRRRRFEAPQPAPGPLPPPPAAAPR